MTPPSLSLAQAFVADPDDRFPVPVDPLWRNAKRRFGALVVIALFLHAALLIALFLHDYSKPEAAAVETPVEVIVLPPPEPKPQPKQPQPKRPPPPKQKPVQLDKPATDAPPPANNEKLRPELSDQATQSPVHGNPVPQAAMKPVPDQAKPLRNAAPMPAEQTTAPDAASDAPDAEPISKPAPIKDRKLTQKEKPAKERAAMAQHDRASLEREFAALSQAPHYSIAAEAKPSPVAGGHCDTNAYLCTLFGLIMRQQRYPENARAQHLEGTAVVAFWVDERGDLVHQALYRTSGHPELDQAAVAAVRRAAPFPPPPPGTPHGFIAQMKFPPN